MLTRIGPDDVILGVYLVLDEKPRRKIISLTKLKNDANKLRRDRPRLLFAERRRNGRIVTYATTLNTTKPLTQKQLEQIRQVILNSAAGTGNERFVAVVDAG